MKEKSKNLLLWINERKKKKWSRVGYINIFFCFYQLKSIFNSSINLQITWKEGSFDYYLSSSLSIFHFVIATRAYDQYTSVPYRMLKILLNVHFFPIGQHIELVHLVFQFRLHIVAILKKLLFKFKISENFRTNLFVQI
jgi:hypothetical protein